MGATNAPRALHNGPDAPPDPRTCAPRASVPAQAAMLSCRGQKTSMVAVADYVESLGGGGVGGSGARCRARGSARPGSGLRPVGHGGRHLLPDAAGDPDAVRT